MKLCFPVGSVHKFNFISFGAIIILLVMSADSAQLKLQNVLTTEEKTIKYAEGQIEDGELMAAKSILDQSWKKLTELPIAESQLELLDYRVLLLMRVKSLQERVLLIRRNRMVKKESINSINEMQQNEFEGDKVAA